MAAQPRTRQAGSGPAALRVGVLGAGTVGREVVRALLAQPGPPRSSDGPSLELVGVAVRDIEAAAARGLPASLLTDAPAHLIAAEDVDVIVEVMGGEEPARTLLSAALAAGKPVVTANKRLVAGHGAELEAIARQTGAPLRFEAAVGGGTPILGLLAAELAGCRIEAVRGIVNGTTNFILTEMEATARPYAVVLAEAQAAGYAEADPSADVEGRDATQKLVILARLAFGVWLDPAEVGDRPGMPAAAKPGITGVTLEDIAAARHRGLVIRLLATARRVPDEGTQEGSVEATVLATGVSAESAFGRTLGVINRIEIEAQPVGRVSVEGPGAGGAATSAAVIGDLIAIARGGGSTWAGLPPAGRAHAMTTSGDPVDASQPWLAGPSGARYPILD